MPGKGEDPEFDEYMRKKYPGWPGPYAQWSYGVGDLKAIWIYQGLKQIEKKLDSYQALREILQGLRDQGQITADGQEEILALIGKRDPRER